jgi:hypothetical protein
MKRDVMLGSLKLNLVATRKGITINYYAQDYQRQSGLAKVRLGSLSAEELRTGGTEGTLDITPILPIARELFEQVGGQLEPDAA